MKKYFLFLILTLSTTSSFASTDFKSFFTSLQKKVGNNKKTEAASLFKFPLKIEVNLVTTTIQSKWIVGNGQIWLKKEGRGSYSIQRIFK